MRSSAPPATLKHWRNWWSTVPCMIMAVCGCAPPPCGPRSWTATVTAARVSSRRTANDRLYCDTFPPPHPGAGGHPAGHRPGPRPPAGLRCGHHPLCGQSPRLAGKTSGSTAGLSIRPPGAVCGTSGRMAAAGKRDTAASGGPLGPAHGCAARRHHCHRRPHPLRQLLRQKPSQLLPLPDGLSRSRH